MNIQADEFGRAVVEVHATVRDLNGSVISDGMVEHIYVIEGGLVHSMEIRQP